jgi:dephospho-CoA kinase
VNLFKLKFFQRKPLVVLDAPLLFESKILEWVCYPIVVVYIDDL